MNASEDSIAKLLQVMNLEQLCHLFVCYKPVGVARGLDVDQPRNLAKSVTVE